MTTRIKHRHTGAVIAEGDTLTAAITAAAGDLAGADLAWANLTGADLTGDLTGADLTWARLTEADLAGADLTGANIAEANLAEANLAEANLARACLTRACLTRAYLAEADLAGADLAWANLTGANLTWANLAGANLAEANLTWANLAGANLAGANIDPIALAALRPAHASMLHDGPHTAYRLVDREYKSPFATTTPLTYRVGDTVEVADANTDPSLECAAGIHVADLQWCLRHRSYTQRIVAVQFNRDDVACIPHATDGKFRLHRCTVIGEIEEP